MEIVATMIPWTLQKKTMKLRRATFAEVYGMYYIKARMNAVNYDLLNSL